MCASSSIVWKASKGAEPFYRLVTTILDPGEAPAEELVALYSERWEIESALDEIKTHLRGARSCCAARRRSRCSRSLTGY